MAQIVKGGSITSPLTASQLHALVDGATISGIAPADLDPNYCMIRIGAYPSPTDSVLCVPTTIQLGKEVTSEQILHLSDGSFWFPVGPSSYGVKVRNNSGSDFSAGDILCRNPDAVYPNGATRQTTATPASSDGHEDVWCIAADDIANGAYGVGIVYGLAYITIKTISGSGRWVKTADTAGQGYSEAWTLVSNGPNYIAYRMGSEGAGAKNLCFVFGAPLKGG